MGSRNGTIKGGWGSDGKGDVSGERLECQFSLIRYVPDAVKNEFVNIGVMLREAARPEAAVVRFTKDWARVRCVDADADIAMLEAMEAEMRQRLVEPGRMQCR